MGYVLTNLISNGNFSSGSTWSSQNNASLTVVATSTNSTLSAAGTPSTAAEKALQVKSGSSQYGQAVYSISGQEGHKYYFRADVVKPDNTKTAGIQLQLAASPYTAYGEDNRSTSWNTWQTLSCIAEVESTANLYACLSVNRSDTTSGLYAYYTNVLLVDLTASFGAGNEPELDWCNANIGYFDGFVDENGNAILPPAGDHNTRIGGTSCEIEGGTVLLGGTVYEIEKGVVLIGGTEYEIPLAGKVYTVTITGNGNDGARPGCHVTIDGTDYTSAATVEVQSGTVIVCSTKVVQQQGSTRVAYIYLNGTAVASTTSASTYTTYSYTIDGDVSVALSVTNSAGIVHITTS